ncbi:DDE-type integrase/transposase/recombinase [Silvanigrella paludirubra]|uniref:DDE-type integrase/transposase/recombinase n=1 Tax=Silvanigrella paludirubra TaxID=2499159 RepID=A0A6N6VW46_9BACT|nr:DDE-type integrase/transposase/recombinase [Silvanigrella paludirubra]KAB8040840.1 DDE-type integrase/transposase/recombinase [Silvanigrella paludirubra]
MKPIAEALGVSRSHLLSTFQQENNNSSRKLREQNNIISDEEIILILRIITNGRPTYGYRRGIGKPKFKITTKIDKQALHCPNLISGDFTSYKPNEIWTSDITYIPTKEGWIYLCIILDTFSRAIIGWSMQDNLKRELVLNSLNMAYKKDFIFQKESFFSTLKKELVHRCNFLTRKEAKIFSHRIYRGVL